MNIKYRLLTFALILCLTVCACATSAGEEATPTLPQPSATSQPTTAVPPTDTVPPPTSTVPPPTETPVPTSIMPPATDTPAVQTEAGECIPEQVIQNLLTDLSAAQFAFVYTGIMVPDKGAVLKLSYWLIDYRLDPKPDDDENTTLNNAGTALETAMMATRYIEDFDPCVDELFDILNPIVVDKYYNGWISFDITSGVLPEKVDLSDPDFKKIMDEHVQLSYVRRDAVTPAGDPPAGKYEWMVINDTLDMHFLPKSLGNTTFFFVRDSHGNNVWAYLDNDDVFASPENFEEQVNQILEDIETLHPAPDNLIVQVLDYGFTFESKRLPKEGIVNKDQSQFVPFP